jgi:mxaA protein
LALLPMHDTGAALAIMHRAFNTLNRQPLFEHRLPMFYRQHPAFAAVAEPLQWFFGYSNCYYFGDGKADAEAMQRLKNLCRLCREIERGNR